MEALSKATGASIITNIDDLNSEELGHAMKVEEKKNRRFRHGIYYWM